MRMKKFTTTTQTGIKVTLHRAWWTLRVEDHLPDNGKLFLMLTLTLSNPTNKVLRYTPALCIQVRNALGHTFRALPLPSVFRLDFATLDPGAASKGFMVFSLYPDEGPFTLVVQEQGDGDAILEVRLPDPPRKRQRKATANPKLGT